MPGGLRFPPSTLYPSSLRPLDPKSLCKTQYFLMISLKPSGGLRSPPAPASRALSRAPRSSRAPLPDPTPSGGLREASQCPGGPVAKGLPGDVLLAVLNAYEDFISLAYRGFH